MADYISRETAIAYIREQSEEMSKAAEAQTDQNAPQSRG